MDIWWYLQYQMSSKWWNATSSRSSPCGQDVADILSGAKVGARTGLKAGLLELESLDA